jgi:hypothetical protein
MPLPKTTAENLYDDAMRAVLADIAGRVQKNRTEAIQKVQGLPSNNSRELNLEITKRVIQQSIQN